MMNNRFIVCLSSFAVLGMLTACVDEPKISKTEIYSQEQFTDAEWMKEKARREKPLTELIKPQIPAACEKVSFRGIACDTPMRNDRSFDFMARMLGEKSLDSYCRKAEDNAKKCVADTNKLLNNLDNLEPCEQIPDGMFSRMSESDVCINKRAYALAFQLASMARGFEHKCNLMNAYTILSEKYPMINYVKNRELMDVEHTGTGFYRLPIEWKNCNR